jgi:putative ABC transport system permease protein
MRRLIQRYLHDILIGIEAIQTNKIKSLLTALGIIFGVAAVISMLAIGNGAEHEILEQIKMVGVNNIIISPSTTTVEGSAGESPAASDETASGKKKFSRGLTLLDAEAIGEVVPTVARVCPVISINYSAILNGRSKPVTLEGTNNHYFDLFNISLQSGQVFNERQQEKGYPVCIIGDNIRNLFFGQEEPVGQYIKAGEVWLQVIGVVERRDFTASASDEMGISSTDNKIFIPVKTMLLRFKNRALVRADEIERQNNAGAAGNENLNQLDKIIVQVRETEQLTVTSQILSRLILRRHNNLYDFEVTIPELLLKQQQRTKNIFNIVLGVIAGISLIVGGIGIMNIMLSSVMERIREIGLRQAIGASRKDIIVQFLAESTLISVVGGIAGIILGVALSKIITAVFDIKTIVSLFSIVIAFGVSALVGITFGYLPARRASDQDPVESLRQ